MPSLIALRYGQGLRETFVAVSEEFRRLSEEKDWTMDGKGKDTDDERNEN